MRGRKHDLGIGIAALLIINALSIAIVGRTEVVA
ncbi:hypothetical protein SAMN06264365_112222 [Actinoplanes regularis]|uniref:Uncharacterized protein n=1 Tax=Actinoplanes regularis TaxID=52697 RepID=A0A239D276_9ACTN|nr:hypothetical protein SAMN06264365_112222 [Actinoplanes regularis]